MLQHIDLFSGIGGFALAAHWAGYTTTVFCEKDEFCQKVLRKHWPNVPIVGDIFDFDGRDYVGADLLTGGIPCQPYSCAGKQLGDADDRALWPQMFRVITEARPRFVVVENVAGFINMALDSVLSDLEAQGYETGTVVLPACAIDAPHRRDRVWIVANNTCSGTWMGESGNSGQAKQSTFALESEMVRQEYWKSSAERTYANCEDVAHSTSLRCNGYSQIGGIVSKSEENRWVSELTRRNKIIRNSTTSGFQNRSIDPMGESESESESERPDCVSRTEVMADSSDSRPSCPRCESQRQGTQQQFSDSYSEEIAVMAGSNSARLEGRQCGQLPECSGERIAGESDPSDANGKDRRKFIAGLGRVVARLPCRMDGHFDAEPAIPRVAKGIPNRAARLKALGNAIVPQVAYQIIRAIREADDA